MAVIHNILTERLSRLRLLGRSVRLRRIFLTSSVRHLVHGLPLPHQWVCWQCWCLSTFSTASLCYFCPPFVLKSIHQLRRLLIP